MIVKKIVDESDYELRTDFVGHGLGIDVHEHPYLSKETTIKLQPGMALAVGVALYNARGLRFLIEDDVLITETGSELLTTITNELRTL